MYEIRNHMDLCMKYAFLNLGKYVHDFFELPGNYNYNAGTEVITCEKRNLRMDVAYFSNEHLINNIENQSTPVDFEKLNVIAEYAKFILIYNNALVNTIVITKVDPKYCLKEINLTKSLILRPYYIYLSPEEILKLLNMIKDKIDNNKKLTYRDAIALALIPILAQDHIAEKVTEEVCHLIEKYQFHDNKLRSDICFLIDIMIDRNIRDENKQKELREEIKMDETRTIIRKLVEEENKDVLEEKDRIIEEKDKKLEENEKKLEDIRNIINNENIDEKSKLSVLSALIISGII
ncbi:hypothetical protein [Methanobrevibacter sp.]|uniref:hypothetical protein n=1 Tax=Methanobrevibacter sp. TaxID=66852 RepID=UPI00388E84B5